jgi:hypothetical protein
MRQRGGPTLPMLQRIPRPDIRTVTIQLPPSPLPTARRHFPTQRAVRPEPPFFATALLDCTLERGPPEPGGCPSNWRRQRSRAGPLRASRGTTTGHWNARARALWMRRGKIVWECKVASEPELLIARFGIIEHPVERIRREAGSLSQWPHTAMSAAGLAGGAVRGTSRSRCSSRCL